MLGVFAGRMMKEGAFHRQKVARRLFLVGVALIVAAWAWSFQMPVIKRIWTCSMTLLSGGYCFLLMALFYYWIDCKGHDWGLNWLKIYGMNSITAYLLGEVVNFRCVVASVSYGLERYLGAYSGDVFSGSTHDKLLEKLRKCKKSLQGRIFCI